MERLSYDIDREIENCEIFTGMGKGCNPKPPHLNYHFASASSSTATLATKLHLL